MLTFVNHVATPCQLKLMRCSLIYSNNCYPWLLKWIHMKAPCIKLQVHFSWWVIVIHDWWYWFEPNLMDMSSTMFWGHQHSLENSAHISRIAMQHVSFAHNCPFSTKPQLCFSLVRCGSNQRQHGVAEIERGSWEGQMWTFFFSAGWFPIVFSFSSF